MSTDRRAFLKQSSAMVAAGAVATREAAAPDAPFAHHVFFWLKNKDDRAARGRLVAALKRLKRVDGVRFLHVGAPMISAVALEAQATEATYTVSYLALFDSQEAKERYLRHPLHVKFVEDFGPSTGLLEKVRIYDSLGIPD